MVTWGEVTRWQPGPLQDAVSALNNAYNGVVACSDDLRDINTADGWHGDAATAAAGKVTTIIDGLEEHAAELAAELAAGRRSAADVGDAITGVQNGVKDAEGIASANHFSIGDDGAVVDNGPPPDVPEDQKEAVAAERKRVSAELADRVKEVIRQATDIDDDFCVVLDRILSGHTIDATSNDNQNTSLAAAGNSGAVMGALSVLPPPAGDASPAANAGWWAALSPNQRQQVLDRLSQNAADLGHRNGLPSDVRDKANRIVFDQQRTDLQHQRDEIARKLGGLKESDPRDMDEYHDLQGKLSELDKKLGGLDKLGDKLHQPPDTPENQRYYLLDIDTRDDGKAILAKGNPDTAANVATYVPGTTADLASFSEEAQRGDAMHAAAQRAGSPSTSVITWLGYDAPDQLPNAASTSYAEGGKQAFQQFETGIRESHTGPPSHNVAIGHSYGTTLIGHAGVDARVPVDDMVFVASPGIGADNPHQLHMAPDHVYSTVAENDIIKVTNIPGPLDALGPDPAASNFGGRVFESAPGTRGLDTDGLLSIAAHGEYWNMTNPSLSGMANIIAGQQP